MSRQFCFNLTFVLHFYLFVINKRHVDKNQLRDMFVKFNSMDEEQVEELYGSKFDINSESPIEDIKYVYVF